MAKTFYYLLTVSYDGFAYYGWAKQTYTPKTIQQQIEKALFVLTKQHIWTLGASKTDAQVHACDQKMLIKLPSLLLNQQSFLQGMNRALPHDIHIEKIKQVPANFNVRCTKMKEYVYFINCSDHYSVWHSRYIWFYNHSFDLKQLKDYFHFFVGEHDFFYYSKLKTNSTTNSIRTINSIDVCPTIINDLACLKIIIQGPSFIHSQIRCMIGSVLYYIHKQINPHEITNHLQNNDYTKTSHIAPGYGLYLHKITY